MFGRQESIHSMVCNSILRRQFSNGKSTPTSPMTASKWPKSLPINSSKRQDSPRINTPIKTISIHQASTTTRHTLQPWVSQEFICSIKLSLHRKPSVHTVLSRFKTPILPSMKAYGRYNKRSNWLSKNDQMIEFILYCFIVLFFLDYVSN